MTAATSVTVKQLTNVGQEMLFEIKATASSGETILIPSTIPVNATSLVKIVSVNNLTLGTALGTITCTYTKASKVFTYTESGATDDDIRIEFRVVN